MIPDLDPATVSWETFGFPDPTFIPAGYGFFALEWALHERGLFASEEDWSNNFAAFVDTPSGSAFHRGFSTVMYPDLYIDFDFALWNVSTRYLHPDRREAYLRGELTRESAVWTIKELMTAAAGGDASAVVGWVDTGTDDWTSSNYRMSRWRFMPEFYLPWLIQRYNALNLLRYCIPTIWHQYDKYYHEGIGGSSSGPNGNEGPYHSLEEAIAKAIEYSSPSTEAGWATPYFRYSYTDPSWSRWGYAVRFYQINKIACYLPGGVINWKGYMGANFSVAENWIETAPAPNYPTPGYHRLESDENGYFTLTDVFPFWSGVTLPTEQDMEYNINIEHDGASDQPRFYFDLYPQFRFKPATV